MLLATSGLIALVGLWLVWVVATVLPARDPAEVPIWAAVAVLGLTAAVAGAAFVRWPTPLSRLALLAAGVMTTAVGVALAATWIATPPGVTGEAYVLLVGVSLAVHGLVGAASSLTSRAPEAGPPGAVASRQVR